MARPDSSVLGIAADNGLVGYSGGRQPGPLFDSEHLIDSWSQTYKKHAWDYQFNEYEGFVAHRYVLYEVTVKGDGSIRVEFGDWISKYSDAIHGNPWQWSEYARKTAGGELVALADVNKIEAGETIYHVPSVPKILDFKPAFQSEPSDQEKMQRVLDHLKNARELDKDVLGVTGDIVSGLGQAVDYADRALAVAEFIADLTKWSGRGASAVGAAAEVIGAAGVFIGFAMIPFQMAELGRREHDVEVDASIATTVAFAFDDLRPTPHQSTIDNISQMYPQDIKEYRQNWEEIVTKTYLHLRTIAIRSVKSEVLKEGQNPIDPELALKVGLRLAGSNKRWKLARLLKEKYENR